MAPPLNPTTEGKQGLARDTPPFTANYEKIARGGGLRLQFAAPHPRASPAHLWQAEADQARSPRASPGGGGWSALCIAQRRSSGGKGRERGAPARGQLTSPASPVGIAPPPLSLQPLESRAEPAVASASSSPPGTSWALRLT